ncbi:MafI family immunity protein [Promicromonospora soli]|uniref:Uncharacterized protein n=1 Tax=Promicromonospora soli TaxID=2035533 RepID=A0A919KS35_9MICO|nr:MafI family immunity protein [Promicromonospora soli]GHH70363.1 hypothetical protein GCM10017772_16870 [Promicromonospora soli]
MRQTRPPAPLLAEIDVSVREAVLRVKCVISADQHDDVIHLLDHNEQGLALETLCSHLYEDDIEIDDDARQLIAHAGNLMGLNPLLWERLAPAPWPALDPDYWWILPIDEPDDTEHLVALRTELDREIAPGHPLHGEPFDILARFAGADEVLVRLTAGRFALVHPTWSRRPEPPQWPKTIICRDVVAAQDEVGRIQQ